MNENSQKKKIRTPEEKKALNTRLNKIIGQMNGIKKMIEDDRYCDDILIKLAATEKRIKSLATVILENHMKTCLVKSIQEGDISVVDELVDLFKRY